MKKILLFDTDEIMISGLKREFQFYRQVAIITPENIQESRNCFSTHKIDLVIMGLNNPRSEGHELLAYMNKNYNDVPVILILEDRSQIQPRLAGSENISHQLRKPVNIKVLLKIVLDELKINDPGVIQGIGLAPFLQMVEMEMKTCALMIKSDEKVGFVYCREGDVIDAEAGGGAGKDAFYHMMCWENLFIRVEEFDGSRDRKIDEPLMHLLMEGSRIRDEKGVCEAPEEIDPESFMDEDDEGEDISDYLLDDDDDQLPLIDVLSNTPGIYEYGIFGHNDLLHIKSPDSRTVMALSPSEYFGPGEKVKQFLNTGNLKHIVIHTKDGIRYLLFKHGESVIVVVLGPGIRPEDVVAKLL